MFASLLLSSNVGLALVLRECRGEMMVTQARGECTIGVFSGAITSDGRPILWKNRDVSDHDQLFIYYSSYQRNGVVTLPFIGNVYRADTTRVYMGANSRGFSIVNSDSGNLSDSLGSGLDDGTLMRLALETCQTLRDFELLLDSTNVSGRFNCWNFATLDATSACAVYECGNSSYVKFSPDGSDTCWPGFMIRANFSLSGDDRLFGLDRYKRAIDLVDRQLDRGPLDVGFVTSVLARDLANPLDDPNPLPYHGRQLNGPPGYIYNLLCAISNTSTSSAAVICGVARGEDPSLTTLFAFLGSPILSVGFPLWVSSGGVPIYLSRSCGAPVYIYCGQRRGMLFDDRQFIFHLNSHYLLDDDGGGVYSYTLPLEAWGMEQASELVSRWRMQAPTQSEVQLEQFRIARAIFCGFQLESAEFIEEVDDDHPALPQELILMNYPNPFNSGTSILYSGFDGGGPVRLRIYDVMGRLLRQMDGPGDASGTLYWDGNDMSGEDVASGVYFYSLTCGGRRSTRTMTLLK